MEIVIPGPSALAVIVLLEAGRLIAIALAFWLPIIAAGVIAGWLAQHFGADPFEALGVGILVCLFTRHQLRPRWSSRQSYFLDHGDDR